MGKIDAKTLLESTDIVEVINRHTKLEKKGYEYYGICPFHKDTKSSLQVNKTKQIYKCFACGAGGDSIDYYTRLGFTFQDALKQVQGDAPLVEITPEKREELKRKVNSWKQVYPVPDNAPPPPKQHYKFGEPVKSWDYRDENGTLVGYICRFETKDGKLTPPLVYATNGKYFEWRWMGFRKPRPLYALDLIVDNPKKSIVVVEGEKAAEASHLLLSKPVATTWIGGAQAIDHTDWTPLKNRRVILFPDHDKPGVEAMHKIASILKEQGCKLYWIHVPSEFPEKWDIADTDWDETQAGATLKNWVKDYTGDEIYTGAQSNLPPWEGEPKPPEEPEPRFDSTLIANSAELGSEYFKFLGHDMTEGGGESYRFFNKKTNKILRYSAAQLTKSNLLTLAPLNFWEMNFPGPKGGINVDHAANFIISTSQEMNLFTEENIRGRGAWVDEKRVVINTGEGLVIDGKKTTLSNIHSRYAYECGKPLGILTENPLSHKESARIIEMLKLVNWEREANAHLLAGWIAIAPICGVLKWRPHIWLTGAAGTGKSWVMDKIIARMLGPTCVQVQGSSTEAGIRQRLGHDALPIVFDEAEGTDKSSQERVQSVLALMRSASSENGGDIMKGTSGGTARAYVIKSCFAFASIAVQTVQHSDISRVTVLGINRYAKNDPNKKRMWKKLQKHYADLINDEFIDRLHARTIRMLPIILKNAEVFSNAAATVLGQQRTGDQTGTLLAGYYSMVSDGVVTYEQAINFIQRIDWSEERSSADSGGDEISLVSHLMQHQIRVNTDPGAEDVTVAELIKAARGYGSDVYNLDALRAEKILRRHGMKVENNLWYISNTNIYLKKILDGTQWARNHHKILLRVEGAYSSKNSMRFGPGPNERATVINLDFILEED